MDNGSFTGIDEQYAASDCTEGGLSHNLGECDSRNGEDKDDKIPYVSIYADPSLFPEENCFIPAYPVTAEIVKIERSTDRVYLISPYIYTIQCNHGPFHWTIFRRYVDFQRLHNNLKVFRTQKKFSNLFKSQDNMQVLAHLDEGDLIQGDNIKPKDSNNVAVTQDTLKPPELKVTIERQSSKVSATHNDPNRRRPSKVNYIPHCPKLPHFPSLPDSVVSESGLEERKAILQHYLTTVLHVHLYRNTVPMATFLEVSRLSFVDKLGMKYNEGPVKKRPGGKYAVGTIRNFCITNCVKWSTTWLVIKDGFVAYLDKADGKIGEVLLYDSDFSVANHAVGTLGHNKGLMISNLQRNLLIKCDDEKEAEQFKRLIEQVITNDGKIWLDAHHYGSSFPRREHVYAQWFVDGASHMACVAEMLDQATEEIFISGWWVIPELLLMRPATPQNEKFRLDFVLQRKAREGVHVMILLYRDIQMLLGLNSLHAEQVFTSLHPNIKVLRHPDHIAGGVFTLTHHEKLVIIDQKIAFVGGIDLCFGRWDNFEHRLTDLGPEAPLNLDTVDSDKAAAFQQLKEESRIKRVEALKFGAENAGASTYPAGEAIPNLASIFKSKYDILEKTAKTTKWKDILDKLMKNAVRASQAKYFPGKDYSNMFYKGIPEPEKPFEDAIDRTVIPRSPWHDISSVVYGSAASDVARHFIQRWNAAKLQLAQKDISIPLLVPKAPETVEILKKFQNISSPCHVQVLRSCSLWSAGINAVESSIQNAYIKLISESKHYIYIENQFFVSLVEGSAISNRLVQALYERIVKAHEAGETFRVYIIIPLLPGFEKTSGALQGVLHWTYLSICKGPNSLMVNLEKKGCDPNRYVTFCSLRTHAELVGRLVTEVIYVHCKMMIIDDKYCIIGSANINDRSMLGDRDSEVAVTIEDASFIESRMNGQPYQGGVFCRSLRRHLMREHLGMLNPVTKDQLEPIDIDDPITESFFEQWKSVAASNTEIYDKVFQCAPADRLRTLEQFQQNETKQEGLADTNKEEALKVLQNIRGHLVAFPTKFLIDSNLTPPVPVPDALLSFIFA